MSLWKRFLITAFLACWVLPAAVCMAGVQAGKEVPGFSLKDVQGRVYDLSSVKDRSMVVLYFFDAASRPSQEFLLTIDSFAGKYREAGLTVWGVTASDRETVAAFTEKAKPGFPILLDTAGVLDAYGARLILPTTCIVGPQARLLDYFQGGGKTTNTLLVRLAERTLQQSQPALAGAISDQVMKSNPKDSSARLVKGYASLESGRMAEAEETFASLAKEGGKAGILGKEGLAGVYARKGDAEKALQAAEEVEKEAPDRPYVNVIRGDILYGRNDKAQAEEQYRKAVQKQGAETFQAAGAYNKLGRLYASAGKFDQSRQLYDQAIEIDPYYVEAMTNKGLTYEREGSWDKALDAYRQSQAVSGDDMFASCLAGRAQAMLAYRDDPGRKERIDKLVKDLSERFRSQKKLFSMSAEDAWTSRPMVMTFIDFQETGVLSDRDGFSTVITTQLADQLGASGRVKVVDRLLIDQLLQELNLGSSDLADPETALKLGKVLAAKLMGTGNLIHTPGGTMMSLRIIDTETSEVPKVVNLQFPLGASLKKELGSLNREILTFVMQSYPLQAFVVSADDQQVMINLGSNQGVVAGTTFDIVEEKAPVEYKGKLLKSAPMVVARVEVVTVEPDLSYCRIIETTRALKRDDKAVEKIDETALKG